MAGSLLLFFMFYQIIWICLLLMIASKTCLTWVLLQLDTEKVGIRFLGFSAMNLQTLNSKLKLLSVQNAYAESLNYVCYMNEVRIVCCIICYA